MLGTCKRNHVLVGAQKQKKKGPSFCKVGHVPCGLHTDTSTNTPTPPGNLELFLIDEGTAPEAAGELRRAGMWRAARLRGMGAPALCAQHCALPSPGAGTRALVVAGGTNGSVGFRGSRA